MPHVAGGLDVVNEGGYSIHGVVVGPQPKLHHGDEKVSLDVNVHLLHNNFLQ